MLSGKPLVSVVDFSKANVRQHKTGKSAQEYIQSKLIDRTKEKIFEVSIFEKELDRITGKNNTMGIIEQVKQMKLDEAREEGEERKSRLFVENLLSSTDFSVKRIASLAGVNVGFVNKVKAALKSK